MSNHHLHQAPRLRLLSKSMSLQSRPTLVSKQWSGSELAAGNKKLKEIKMERPESDELQRKIQDWYVPLKGVAILPLCGGIASKANQDRFAVNVASMRPRF